MVLIASTPLWRNFTARCGDPSANPNVHPLLGKSKAVFHLWESAPQASFCRCDWPTGRSSGQSNDAAGHLAFVSTHFGRLRL